MSRVLRAKGWCGFFNFDLVFFFWRDGSLKVGGRCYGFGVRELIKSWEEIVRNRVGCEMRWRNIFFVWGNIVVVHLEHVDRFFFSGRDEENKSS